MVRIHPSLSFLHTCHPTEPTQITIPQFCQSPHGTTLTSNLDITCYTRPFVCNTGIRSHLHPTLVRRNRDQLETSETKTDRCCWRRQTTPSCRQDDERPSPSLEPRELPAQAQDPAGLERAIHSRGCGLRGEHHAWRALLLSESITELPASLGRISPPRAPRPTPPPPHARPR